MDKRCLHWLPGTYLAHFAKPALRVLSVLDSHGGAPSDVISSLKPFFAPIVCDFDGSIFDPQEIADEINARYFWRVTPEIVENLAGRFAEWGWISRLPSDGKSAAYVIDAKSIQAEATQDEAGLATTVDRIGQKFRAFLDASFPDVSNNATPAKLASDLIEWLVSIDAFTVKKIREQILGYEVDEFGTMLPKLSGTQTANTLDHQESYLCARFAKSLSDAQDPLFEELVRLAQVGLLTEVVQDFGKPVDTVNKTDLTLYLDSPLALDALGMSGKASRDSMVPVLEALKGIGGRIVVLRVSVEELKTSLNAMLQANRAYRTGPTAEALRRREITERDVTSVARAPENALLKLGITVEERTLSMYPNEHKFFTQADFSQMKKIYGIWAPNYAAEDHDATLVTMVMRRRGQTRSADFLTSKFVAVSKNSSVITDAEGYCYQRQMLMRGQVPPVIHSKQLSTMVWLRTGLSTGYDVPRSTLLAACQRVLSLTPRMIDLAISKAREMSEKTEEELRACLTVDRSSMVLMDRTTGDPRLLTGRDMGELLEEMKKAVAEKEINQARAELLAESAATLAKSEATLAEERRALAETQAALATREAESAALGVEREALLREQDAAQDRLASTQTELERKTVEANDVAAQRAQLAQRLAEHQQAKRVAIEKVAADTNAFVAIARKFLQGASVALVVLAFVLSLMESWTAIPLWLAAAALSVLAFVGISTNLASYLSWDISIYRLTTPLCASLFRFLSNLRGLGADLPMFDVVFEKDTVRVAVALPVAP